MKIWHWSEIQPRLSIIPKWSISCCPSPLHDWCEERTDQPLDADAKPGTPRRRRSIARRLHSGQAGHFWPRRSTHTQSGLFFRPPGLHTITPGAARRMPGNCFFPTLQGVLHAPGRWLLLSLYSSSTSINSGDLQWGWTSDLPPPRAALRAKPCEEPGYTPGPNQLQWDGILHHAGYTVLPVQSTTCLHINYLWGGIKHRCIGNFIHMSPSKWIFRTRRFQGPLRAGPARPPVCTLYMGPQGGEGGVSHW